MSRLLLDSNVLLRWLLGELDERATERIGAPRSFVAISAATPWELAIKEASGKLRMPEDPTVAARRAGFEVLDITAAHGQAAACLPLHHRDPFDRIMIAQAQLEGLTILSRDRAFEAYDVELIAC